MKKQIIPLKTRTKMGVLKDDNGIAVIVLMGSYFINAYGISEAWESDGLRKTVGEDHQDGSASKGACYGA